MFDIKENKDVIIKAAWEAGSRYVSIDSKYMDRIVTDLMFYLTYDGILDKNRTRKIFMEYLLPTLKCEDMVLAYVCPRELACAKSNILLIKGGEWVYD